MVYSPTSTGPICSIERTAIGVDCTGFLVDVLNVRDPDDLRNVQYVQHLLITSICHLAHRIMTKVNITYHETLESSSLEPHHPNVQMSNKLSLTRIAEQQRTDTVYQSQDLNKPIFSLTLIPAHVPPIKPSKRLGRSTLIVKATATRVLGNKARTRPS